MNDDINLYDVVILLKDLLVKDFETRDTPDYAAAYR